MNRKEVMKHAREIGHCVCNLAVTCPCNTLKQQNICICAGESVEEAMPYYENEDDQVIDSESRYDGKDEDWDDEDDDFEDDDFDDWDDEDDDWDDDYEDEEDTYPQGVY